MLVTEIHHLFVSMVFAFGLSKKFFLIISYSFILSLVQHQHHGMVRIVHVLVVKHGLEVPVLLVDKDTRYACIVSPTTNNKFVFPSISKSFWSLYWIVKKYIYIDVSIYFSSRSHSCLGMEANKSIEYISQWKTENERGKKNRKQKFDDSLSAFFSCHLYHWEGKSAVKRTRTATREMTLISFSSFLSFSVLRLYLYIFFVVILGDVSSMK